MMNSQIEETKQMIEQVFGDALEVIEVCEIYAELYHYIKDQMQFVIKTLTSGE